MHRRFFVIPVVFSCLALLFGSGCGGKKEVPAERSTDHTHIMQAAMVWNAYRTATKKMPSSGDELKTWAKANKSKLPKDVKDVDAAFVSTRDNEPYVFVQPKGNRMGMGIVVYEKSGVDGVHLAASNMGSVTELKGEALQDTLSKN